ncbi:MAG: hypothetical protein AABN34_01785 [Acidobacteriota bacterium]
MQEALRKLLIGLASQVPLLGSIYVYWEQVQQRPLVAGLIGILYEALVFAFGFGKKVWIRLEPEAVEYAASAVRSGIGGFAPGYLRRYRRQVVIDHGIFNVRGMGLIDACTLNLDHVFVELRIETSSNPAGANLDPIAVKELASKRTIWEFLRFKLQRRCVSRIIGHGLKGIDIWAKDFLLSWPYWRFRLKQKQAGIEGIRKTLLDTQQWLQIVMEREEGTLPAREGIRIVREMVEPDPK